MPDVSEQTPAVGYRYTNKGRKKCGNSFDMAASIISDMLLNRLRSPNRHSCLFGLNRWWIIINYMMQSWHPRLKLSKHKGYFGLNTTWGLIQYKAFISIRKPIVAIRRSYDRLTSTIGVPILVRRHLSNESEPGSWLCRHTCRRSFTCNGIRKIIFSPCINIIPLVWESGKHWNTSLCNMIFKLQSFWCIIITVCLIHGVSRIKLNELYSNLNIRQTNHMLMSDNLPGTQP